jgi:hypothetical protein
MSTKAQSVGARQNQPAKASGPAAAAATPPQEKELRELTTKIAFELFEKRGHSHGRDVEDWLEAERLAKQKLGIK